jgi:hypothetical protein
MRGTNEPPKGNLRPLGLGGGQRFVPKNKNRAVLLLPERQSDGTRTFKLVKGSIQPGYASELWKRIVEKQRGAS